jgi:hypothetical protein
VRFNPRVIQHIVLIRWKPGTTDEQIAAAFDEAHRLTDAIGSVQQVTLGRNRGQADHGFTHALIVGLSREDALDEYLDHPVRKAYVAEVLEPLVEQRIEVDVPVDLSTRREPARNWEWGATAGMGVLDDE